MISVVIRHVAYKEEHYRDAASCLRALRRYLQLGWVIVEIRGVDAGPLSVLYRIDDES